MKIVSRAIDTIVERGTSQKYFRRNCSSETAARNCAAKRAAMGEFGSENWMDSLFNKGLEIFSAISLVSGCLTM